MNNFYCYNPAKILFGKGMIARIDAEMKDVDCVLLLYGLGSIRRNGAYEQVRAALAGKKVVEFGGIEPNPEYETCLQALELARQQGVEFILGVGGGSVIDASKFIATAFFHAGSEPWRIVTGEEKVPPKVLPIGCVQTVAASGSEFNNAFVLSRRAQREKRSFFAPSLYPRFSVLDPEITLTLSRHQTALGLVDMFVHVLEQYVTWPRQAPLQDRQAEAILATVREIAQPLLARPDNYELRATAMWCGAQAVSGLLSRGVPTDWATHLIGHELTALYDLPHAQTLALVLGGVWRWEFAHKRAMLAQYGRRIWGLEGEEETVAEAAIQHTEKFFEELGIPTRFSALGLDSRVVARSVRENLSNHAFQPLGERRAIGLDAVESILLSRD